MADETTYDFFQDFPLIRKWLGGGTVSTRHLGAELKRAYAVVMDGLVEDETWAEGLGADESRPSQLAPGQKPYVDPSPERSGVVSRVFGWQGRAYDVT